MSARPVIARLHPCRVGTFALSGLLALCALLVQAIPQARAQSPIFMTAPPPLSRVFEGSDPAAAPAEEPAAPQAPVSEPPAAARPPAASPAAAQPAASARPGAGGRAEILRHLPNNVQGYRLAGEIGVSEWPIFLTDTQARRKLKFQLGYLAAVSVMPELSTMTLTINDQIVGETPISAVHQVKTVLFEIPPGLMRPGFNSLRLSTQQRHRVDCSLEATNELWTQIDPTKTGLMIDQADSSIASLDDLAALPPDELGALPIRVVTPAKATTAEIDRMMRAVQLLSILGRFEQPVVDSGPLAGGPYGVNLIVGTTSELASVAPDLVGAAAGPRAFIIPATPVRRTTIVVTGATPAHVNEAMRQFLVAHKPKGTIAGLRAAVAFPGFRVEGGKRVKLSELGIKSEEFDGRLYRAAFNIIMPPDFYPADYGRATLRVAGGYAPGLTSKAQLVMYVNGRTAVSLPLLKSRGEVFKDSPLPLPLGFLRPGLNRIEIEAHVPSPSDESCDTLAAKDAPNRFLFLNSTELEIPEIARVGRLPDLAVTATGGFPFAGAARRPNLYLPRLDAKSIGATATLVAHFAIAAGRPIDFEITQTPPKGKEPILAVGTYDAFSVDLLRKLELPTDDLSRMWRDRIGAEQKQDAEGKKETAAEADARYRHALQNNFPMACRAEKQTGLFRHAFDNIDLTPTGSIGSDDEPEPAQPAKEEREDSRDLFEEWDSRVRNEARLSTAVLDWLTRAREWVRVKFTDAGEWIRTFEAAGEQREIKPQTLLAIGQNLLGDSGDEVWTLVTAPNADALAQSVACLVDPRISRQIAGRVSLLDVAQAKVDVTRVTRTRFVATQPLSAGNARLIAAGWLSLHALYYVVGAISLAFMLGLTTRIFVRNVGRRSDG